MLLMSLLYLYKYFGQEAQAFGINKWPIDYTYYVCSLYEFLLFIFRGYRLFTFTRAIIASTSFLRIIDLVFNWL